MQNINSELYRTNIFYRDLVDKMLANEKDQKIRQLELEQQLRQRQAECERLQAELDFRKSRVFGYANQIPYQSMTPISRRNTRALFRIYKTTLFAIGLHPSRSRHRNRS